MTAVVLLVELADSNTVGIRFPDVETARDWEDAHDGELIVRGCVEVISGSDALRLSR